ncbi:hypothetical protein BD410DRAFT_638349 [Rickenella mellea]|uniref:Uncharacterized protein n=1 Tax=Rickenella mellea TaxID=50990 RepID=A0A4Y7QCI4_9AGAM|nr:hypothetical protein BD410DRAFT_638349 [Rickenella mellea]
MGPSFGTNNVRPSRELRRRPFDGAWLTGTPGWGTETAFLSLLGSGGTVSSAFVVGLVVYVRCLQIVRIFVDFNMIFLTRSSSTTVSLLPQQKRNCMTLRILFPAEINRMVIVLFHVTEMKIMVHT